MFYRWTPRVTRSAITIVFAVLLQFPPIAGGSRWQSKPCCQGGTQKQSGESVQKIDATPSEKNRVSTRRVYVGTNRLPVKRPDGKPLFGSKHGPLHFARCDVTVSRCYRRGELDGIAIRSFQLLECTHELPAANSQSSNDKNHNVLVYVHGFYVAFEESIRRAVQIAHELKFDGTIFVYTWPSAFEMTPDAYCRDRGAVERSVNSFRKFLCTLGQRYESCNVSILAHSLGCQLVAKAARSIASERNPAGPKYSRLANILFAAPDIPTTEFRAYDRAALEMIAKRVTVYHSTKDRILRFAEKFSTIGERLGRTTKPHRRVSGPEFVDYSLLPGGTLNLRTHNLYRNHPAIIQDLRGVLNNTIPCSHRLLFERRKFSESHK